MYKGFKGLLLSIAFLHISFFSYQVLCSSFTLQDPCRSPLSKIDSHSSGRRFSFLPANTDCFITGQVQEGFFYGKNIRTLNNDVPDVQTRFRHRMHVGFHLKHYDPLLKDKKTIVEAALKLHNMQWWQDENSNLLIR